ncbi:TetR/AcrR family transcriptional regulator [Caenimonas sedimenti]|uniref:TetR/AcrR family transcriptional regulator n=1 Tax=Caenimonas sedimenti TaxID=2596921 RepID=A0A562ZX28_9BURK|nr:TetR/AcrR family transcriptional regulator [Caenimonas sedimenti]TWO72845.1 TetR/AcrR family transcriptional regulator [Caenimonas sedimenti]
MDLQPTRKQLTHDRIVDTAARAIRATGFHGVGVADIMKQCGLTHGGFYAHFASREALLAEALERAGAESRERMREAVHSGMAKGSSPLRAFVENYLADRHLEAPEGGCPVAALASEMPRQAPELRAAAVDRVKALLAGVASVLPPGSAKESPAIIASQLVGALQLARTVGDNAQGRALLAASRESLLAQFEAPAS